MVVDQIPQPGGELLPKLLDSLFLPLLVKGVEYVVVRMIAWKSK